MLLLLLGCNTGAGVEGIWALILPPAPDATCTTNITHNFLEGTLPEEVDEDPPWLSTKETDESEALVMAQVIGSSRTGATLVVDDALYPGTRTEEGEWEFLWVGSEQTDELHDHLDGYTYTLDRLDEASTVLLLRFDGDVVTGSWSEEDVVDRAWTESDTWPETVAEVGETGVIPVGTWVSRVDGSPLTNTRGAGECTSEECVLEVREACSAKRELTGFRTGYDDEDFEHLAGTGQGSGT